MPRNSSSTSQKRKGSAASKGRSSSSASKSRSKNNSAGTGKAQSRSSKSSSKSSSQSTSRSSKTPKKSLSDAQSGRATRKSEEEIYESERFLDDHARRDVGGVVVGLIAIILLVCALMPVNGVVSSFISTSLHLCLGLGAYILPLFLLGFAVSFFFRHEDEQITGRVALGLFLIFIALLGLLALFTPGSGEAKIDALFEESHLRALGGYVGAGLTWCGLTLFGNVITAIIHVGVIAMGLAIVGFSVSRLFEAIQDKHDEYMTRRQEEDEPMSAPPFARVRSTHSGSLRASGLHDADTALLDVQQEAGDSAGAAPSRASGNKLFDELFGLTDETSNQGDASVQGVSGLQGAQSAQGAQGAQGMQDAPTSNYIPLTDIGYGASPTRRFDAQAVQMTRRLSSYDDIASLDSAAEAISARNTVLFGAPQIDAFDARVPDEYGAGLPDFLNADGHDELEAVSSEALAGDASGHDLFAANAAADAEGREQTERASSLFAYNLETIMGEHTPLSDLNADEDAQGGEYAAGEQSTGFAEDFEDTEDTEDAEDDAYGASSWAASLPKIDATGITDAAHSAENSAATANNAVAATAAAAAGAQSAKKRAATSKPKRARNLPLAQPRATEGFELPPASMLNSTGGRGKGKVAEGELRETAALLQETLEDFGIEAKVVGWVAGPTVTLFKVDLPKGVRVSRVTALNDDIALALAAPGVRIFAPIPGTNYVGIEVPNQQRQSVLLGDVLKTAPEGPLQIAIGMDVEGNSIVSNLAKMPHLLIGGTTGSGKSVSINAMIMSILMRATPDEVRFILIDPKRVEFSLYNDIPHLYVPVVTEPKEAASALSWGVAEMERRLKIFSKAGARNIGQYNAKVQNSLLEDESAVEMPYIVIVIDELADLMMNVGKEVEFSISRIAQLARAAGIHLIVATQRPSANVVTGLIKANITNRIAFNVASGIDSRVILDSPGAESLIGLGDLLLSKPELSKPQRIQGCYVSEDEIEDVVDFIKDQGEPDYHNEILSTNLITLGASQPDGSGGSCGDDDPLIWEAAEMVVSSRLGSTSNIQRRLKVGYSRAGRIMDMLEEKGVVGPANGSKPREVLIDELELEALKAFETGANG